MKSKAEMRALAAYRSARMSTAYPWHNVGPRANQEPAETKHRLAFSQNDDSRGNNNRVFKELPQGLCFQLKRERAGSASKAQAATGQSILPKIRESLSHVDPGAAFLHSPQSTCYLS